MVLLRAPMSGPPTPSTMSRATVRPPWQVTFTARLPDVLPELMFRRLIQVELPLASPPPFSALAASPLRTLPSSPSRPPILAGMAQMLAPVPLRELSEPAAPSRRSPQLFRVRSTPVQVESRQPPASMPWLALMGAGG